MSNVSKHYPKKERERHSSKEGRINLLIVWDSVSIYDVLKHTCEFVSLDVCRWLDVSSWYLFDLNDLLALVVIFLDNKELVLKFMLGKMRPHESMIQIPFSFKHVQCLIDLLFLPNEQSIHFVQ